MAAKTADVAMEEEEELYTRTLADVKEIIKHAKLDEKTLTPITQVLYYPSSEFAFDSLKLLELNDHIFSQIKEGKKLHFKGGLNEKVVLCTDEKTYDVKVAETSNSLLLIPDLKLAAATTTSPLKSPKNTKTVSPNTSLNDSHEDVDVERTIENRQVLKIFHEYFECREINPKFRKLAELLQMTRYSGPENECHIDRKLLFTFNQLLDTIQCSRKQYVDGLKEHRAIELDGYIRIMEYDYEYRIINYLLGLIAENSWALNEIERQISIDSMEGIAPKEIVAGLFDLYTESSDIEGKFQYKVDMVARIVARNILQPGLKFRIEEFLVTWQDALPEGMSVEQTYLRGLGIIDKESPTPCIRSLSEENLTTNLYERLKVLFKTKPRWTLEEMEPYIEYFSTPTMSVSTILAKYARTLLANGQRVYVAKHS